ncbi:MAG: UDP-glucosyltransferase [Polyangiaceae bacterium]|nr:UDP-glucosyltransferase [Polyangiaceae bacterium]
MSRSLRVVAYAVNGAGAGHLVRLVAIARWLRRYAAWSGVRLEVFFLTSSEADGLPLSERFASFKLPSKTMVAEARIDKTTYLALAKQWVWQSIALLRPDLFVVDTFPAGAFGELVSALDLCRRRAIVYRPMLEEHARRPEVQALLPLYDRILIPESEDHGGVLVPAAARGRSRFVGPVAVRDRVELPSREESRARLGLPAEARVAYVSAGGGGDAHAGRQLAAGVEALLAVDPELRVVLGAGPLHRGRLPRGPRVTPLVHEVAAELAPAFDLAVSAAGYNAFVELMLAGVPTVFVPQPKIADDQAARALRAVRAGAARVVEDGAPAAELAAAARALLEPAAAHAASLAARALVPRSCARVAAAELLRLCLPAPEVDRAEAAVTDALLGRAGALGVPEELLVELMHALDGDGGHASPARELGSLLRAAGAIVELARAEGAPLETLGAAAHDAVRRLRDASVEDRRSAIERVVLRERGAAGGAGEARPC